MDWLWWLPWKRPKKDKPPNPDPDLDLVAAINLHRMMQNRKPLGNDHGLRSIASSWANRMADDVHMRHGDWAEKLRVMYPNSRAGAENVGMGYADSLACADGWMGSPPHRNNILAKFNAVGVGVARGRDKRLYWCAVFASL